MMSKGWLTHYHINFILAGMLWASSLLLTAHPASAGALTHAHADDTQDAEFGAGANDSAGEAVHPQDFADVLVASLQQPGSPAKSWGYGLSGEALLGHYGLTAEQVLAEIAPHLTRCSLKLIRAQQSGDALHETYALFFGPLPLENASLQLHHYKNRLVMLRAELPAYRLPEELIGSEDFLSVEALGYEISPEQEPFVTQTAQSVIANSAGFPAAAWRLERWTEASGVRWVVDAQTGALLSEKALGFDIATVFERGPQDGGLVEVDLEGLQDQSYLDGDHFQVFAPREDSPRARAVNGDFRFSPVDPINAIEFDQVQTYYGATRALAYFRDTLGWDASRTHMTIRIGDLVGGTGDNAVYVPNPSNPEIRIGKGGTVLANLARDTDVISHEFAHHVIYDHLQSQEGESGVLHEGFADYFAYAINGDPNLGESIVIGGGALRSAALNASDRYELVPPQKGHHFRGQYWSAVLWEIRQRLGHEADQLIYDSLAYLAANSGLSDALLALLNADRDLNPLPYGDAENGVYGRNKCLILSTAVTRGFAQWLAALDGRSCHLDLPALAADSRSLSERSAKTAEKDGPRVGFTMFGKSCAIILSHKNLLPHQGLVLSLILMFALPGCLVLIHSVYCLRSRRHGS